MQPKLQLLSLNSSIFIWCIFGIISLSIYFYANGNSQKLQHEFDQLELHRAQQSTLVKTMQQEISELKRDPLLLNEIEQKQIVLRLKKRVMNELVGQENLKSNGFSTLMLDLASHHEPGLWLTRVSLEGQRLTLAGAAEESSSVPKWVGNLSNTTFFKGKEFADARMFRDEQQQLFFVLASDFAGEASEGGVNER
jgi:Tfp pilus assembly protein PilN